MHAYEEWGEGCAERLWGMFALAVWDEDKRRLLLARDRFGKKPLFYAQAAALCSSPPRSRRCCAIRPSPQPRRPQPGGHVHRRLCARPGDDLAGDSQAAAGPRIGGRGRKWFASHLVLWDAPYPPAGEETRVDPQEAVDEVRELLKDAVRLRLQSDVPVGALLSGGLDSTGLVALMQELSGGQAHTFSIGFAEASHDESAYARLGAAHLGTEHHVLQFDRAAFDCLPRWWPPGSPQCFATAVPIWLLYKACPGRVQGHPHRRRQRRAVCRLPWFHGNRQADPLMRLPQLCVGRCSIRLGPGPCRPARDASCGATLPRRCSATKPGWR